MPGQLSIVGGAVLGGGSLAVPEWTAFLAEHYLAEYLPAGGAAVKLAVCGTIDTTERLRRALAAAADAAECLFVVVSAHEVKLSQVDAIFFQVARAVDWDVLAVALARRAYAAADFPAGRSVRVAEVADEHEVDSGELYRSVRRELERLTLGNLGLTREMRRAALRLASAQIRPADVEAGERQAILDWLRGDLRGVKALRPARITTKIGRHSARDMLRSLSVLLVENGRAGLVLLLDGTRLAEARRPPVEQRSGVYYSKAAVLDAYEVLRQLIDATDDLRGVLVVAAVPPEVVTDETRGLPAYTALQLRVADEVRDRRRANPFAALVRLEVRLEAVPE